MLRLLCLLFIILASSCQQEAKLFNKIPSEISNITFQNRIANSSQLNILNYLYFYNGAGVAVGDFNNDGLVDLYFVANQDQDKLYLNKGNLEFEDYSFPESTNGRWIVMDAEDMDADGDIDIVLGSFVYFQAKGDTTGLGEKWMSSGPSIIVLENTIR